VSRLVLALTFSAALFAQSPVDRSRRRAAQALYRENCVVCHDVDQATSKKPGPSFYRLFERDKMPIANTKPNRAYIKVRVKFGGPLMPAFGKTLTDAEIDLILDYLEGPVSHAR
jgi:mono/diheme cytochrome c family protein